MRAESSSKLKVFVDADVLFAGSAAPSEHSASHVVLQMGELTLLDCVTSQQVITEVERNLTAKLPAKIPEFRLLVNRCLHVVADPKPSDLKRHAGEADAKDLSILVAALREGCACLLTFNVRHFHPIKKPISIQRPGEFVLMVRERLATLTNG